MHAEHRVEAAPREPAQQQFLEGGIGDIAAHEAADIARPPGDARQLHGKARLQLLPHGAEGGVDVAGPGQHGVLLAAGPGAAGQGHDLRFARFLQAIVEALGVAHGIHVGGLQRRAREVAVVVEFVAVVLRLGLVQPEAADALRIIILLAAFPDELLRAGVGGVEVVGRAHPGGYVGAAVGADDVAVISHGVEVLALFVDGGPHGHDGLDAHVLELLHHRVGIRPIEGLKLEVALAGPVEEIHHDRVQGQAHGLVLAGDGHQLILGAVAQLALPVAHAVLGHHGSAAGGGGVVVLNLRRSVAAGDVVVQLLGGAGRPLGAVGGEGGGADGRVVPQEAIAAAGDEEGHAGLGIAVAELQGGALLVQVLVLILAHAEDHLVVVGLEQRGEGEVRGAGDGLQFPRGNAQGGRIPVDAVAVAPVFLGEQLALLVPEAQPALLVDLHRQLSVGNGVHLARLMIMGVLLGLVPGIGGVDLLHGDDGGDGFHGLGERPVVGVHLRLAGHADAEAVAAPGVDPQLGDAAVDDHAGTLLNDSHALFLLYAIQ